MTPNPSNLRKFDSNNDEHRALAARLPFGYVAALPFLDFCAYVLTESNELRLVWPNDDNPREFESIFLPAAKKNWANALIAYASSADIVRLAAARIGLKKKESFGAEYYYRTADFIRPQRVLAKKIKQFQKKFPRARILHAYPSEPVLAFHDRWQEQLKDARSLPGMKTDRAFFQHCLENPNRYDIRRVYVELEGKLIGLAWGTTHSSGNWIGLHLKADHEYRGLAHLLLHERAKLFADHSMFTLGVDCNRPGLAAFKRELGPAYTVDFYQIATADPVAQN
ncbi:hypothetical protein KJ611_04295 [Patescibacteria group bacterium]|nr:hypothetical protein [Patescibacteria group bacterium]MBU1705431.1 hypothetical protein [Patescibacteria group bacterium]